MALKPFTLASMPRGASQRMADRALAINPLTGQLDEIIQWDDLNPDYPQLGIQGWASENPTWQEQAYGVFDHPSYGSSGARRVPFDPNVGEDDWFHNAGKIAIGAGGLYTLAGSAGLLGPAAGAETGAGYDFGLTGKEGALTGPTFKGSIPSLVEANAYASGGAGLETGAGYNFGLTGLEGGGPLMPPAVPETAAQLKEWGLQEIAPGQWTLPAMATPSVLQAAEKLLSAGSTVAQVASALGISEGVARAIGALGAAGLGAYASGRQADSLAALAEKYAGYGAPSRARYEGSFAPGFTMESDPGYKDALDQVTKSFLHKASIQGNPADSPNAWLQTLKDVNSQFAFPALQNYRQLNANAGGIASGAAAAPGLDTSAIGARSNVFNAIGAGVSDIFNPPKSLAQQLLELKQAGLWT